MAVRSALYRGTLMHARSGPAANVFRYPVVMALLDLEELPELSSTVRGFEWNSRAPAAYWDRDHDDIRALLAEHGVSIDGDDRLEVLTNLRVLGYVFNPVSFWWARRADGCLAAIVAEVNNTFGERWPYVLLPEDATVDAVGRRCWQAPKRLHVSPFMSMDQRYTWWLSEPTERVSVRIDVHEDGKPDFRATLAAERIELTSGSLRAALVRYPIAPAMVTARIHWQAFRLWRKRAPFFRKPSFVPGRGSVR